MNDNFDLEDILEAVDMMEGCSDEGPTVSPEFTIEQLLDEQVKQAEKILEEENAVYRSTTQN